MSIIKRQFSLRLSIFSLLTLVILGPAHVVTAATITVDDNCSLKNAIISANHNTAYGGCAAGNGAGDGADTIVMDANVILSSINETIDSIITIDGKSNYVNGNGRRRLFTVHGDGNGSAKLTIKDLTLRSGKSNKGGAIYVQFAELDIMNSKFSSNRATVDGGAIWAYETHTTIVNTLFESNTAEEGGAIYSADLGGDDGTSLAITGSTFTDNSATGDIGYSRGYGGAIFNAKGSIVIKQSSFHNSSGSVGGALAGGLSATIDVENSTFYDNMATRGGAIAMSGRTMVITNNTFNANTATDGGALYAGSSFSQVKMYNTIIAGTGANQCDIVNLNGDSGNHVADATCSSAKSGSLGLGAVMGMPAYYPLMASSLAINAGNDNRCPDTDIRGQARVSGHCDIGAYEYIPSAATATPTVSGSGQELVTATATGTPAQPSPPTNLTAVKVDNGVKLRWTASADALEGYNILRFRPEQGDTEPQQLIFIPFGNTTSFTDSTATAAEEYVYHLRSVNGDLLSELSNEARIDLSPTATPTLPPATSTSTSTVTSTATPTQPPPTATNTSQPLNNRVISGLTLTSNQPGQLTVSWDAPAETPVEYRINWAQSGQTFPKSSRSSGNAFPTSPSFSITGLDGGVRYKVRVRARYSNFNGPFSDVVRADVLAAPPPTNTPIPPPTNTPIPPPTNTQVPPSNTPVPPPTSTPVPRSAKAASNISLVSNQPGVLQASWTAPATTPDDYRISWARVGERYKTWTDNSGNAFPTSPSYTITGLDEGVRYKVKVRARYDDGDPGPWAGQVKADVAGSG